jgi:tRNA(Arg) A34 adenosine deaminase TadA
VTFEAELVLQRPLAGAPEVAFGRVRLWDTSAVPDLDAMWPRADAALLRCLELAHQSFLAGGLPVGSVIVAGSGEPVSEGRNRAYDPAGGADRLQRTPIAHAEMNALAGIDTRTDLSGMTLWSSHQPCMMCAAACEFTGVGAVVFIAPDPSDDHLGQDPDGITTEWVIAANLLFLSGVAAYSGPSSPMIMLAGQREPEIISLMRVVGDAALRQPALRDALAPAWPDIQAAASDRRSRHGRTT